MIPTTPITLDAALLPVYLFLFGATADELYNGRVASGQKAVDFLIQRAAWIGFQLPESVALAVWHEVAADATFGHEAAEPDDVLDMRRYIAQRDAGGREPEQYARFSGIDD